MKLLQCCEDCTPNTAEWIFETKVNSFVTVCTNCYHTPGLKEISKGIWKINDGEYQEISKEVII